MSHYYVSLQYWGRKPWNKVESVYMLYGFVGPFSTSRFQLSIFGRLKVDMTYTSAGALNSRNNTSKLLLGTYLVYSCELTATLAWKIPGFFLALFLRPSTSPTFIISNKKLEV